MMTRLCFQLLLIVCCIARADEDSLDTRRLVLHFFGSPTCAKCLDIKQTILFPAQKSHPGQIDLRIHDVDTDSGFNLLMTMEESYGVKASAAIELFFPDTFLTGSDDIHTHAQRLLEQYLALPGKRLTPTVGAGGTAETGYSRRLAERFKSFSFVSILLAGLIDGINPCAIATMIFLVSFLATQRRSRREILTIGLCFTLAVFCTYLLLGIGAFKAIIALDQYRWLSMGIRWTAVAFAGIVGALSFIDALRYSRSHSTGDIKVQLPRSLKLRIHKVIAGNLSGGQLAIGAVVTGFLVTLLEAVCTGQLYLPTIILMTKQQGWRSIGWLYLLFYNCLFVAPLLVVMVLAYYGMKWERLAQATQKNLVTIKVCIGIVLIGLAAFLATAA
jgi:cytochrome c biogenesis protein CcdA